MIQVVFEIAYRFVNNALIINHVLEYYGHPQHVIVLGSVSLISFTYLFPLTNFTREIHIFVF